MTERRQIALTQDQVTWVSAHRYEDLTKFKWYARWNKPTKSFYAARLHGEFARTA